MKKNRPVKLASLLILIAVLCMLSGCMGSNSGELYSLPEPSEGYLALKERIESILNSGAEYSAPISGEHRQSVQLHDIDNDGTDEAIAFFAQPGEKPLKIYVFHLTERGYETAAVVEGDGTSIGNVSYADLNGDGALEIIVGWQMSGGVQMLGAYSLKDYEATPEMLTDYTRYITGDMDGDGAEDITVVRYDRASMYGSAETYFFRETTGVESSVARLSANIESIDRIRTTKLINGSAAIFVEGSCGEGGLLTDVLSIRNGMLCNISVNEESGESRDTVRNYAVYSADINSDGSLDVPVVQILPTEEDSASYRMINWYNYNISGQRSKVVSTYHNYSDGWYFVLPEQWLDKLTLRRDDNIAGERSVIFSVWHGEDEPAEDFLIISAITGNNRNAKAQKEGRVILREEDETIYTIQLLETESGLPEMPENEELLRRFGIIYSEWITGTT